MIEYPNFSFDILKTVKDSQARLGRINTPHGSLDTPNFIFCATKAAIKSAGVEDVQAVGGQIILANTYHLMLQPGADLIEKMGGLHAFTGWQGPMLTDSGGFQVFSLGGHGTVADGTTGTKQGNKGRFQSERPKTLTEITEDGAVFRSYIDGKKHLLNPETSMDIQRKLGADFIVMMDECTPYDIDKAGTRASMEMSHRWGDRSLTAFEKTHDGKQAMYGVIQGGVYADLRGESAEFIASRPFFGQGIGGLLGADKAEMHEVMAYCMDRVHRGRPTHFLGLGGVDDIWNGVALGADTFDCVTPTRIARHGWAMVRWAQGYKLNLRNARFREDAEPLDDECDCSVCQTYSRAYIHHLLKAKEMQGLHLLTVHNMRFMMRLLETIRGGDCR